MSIKKDKVAYLYQQYLNNNLSDEEQLAWTEILADESLQDTLKELMHASYYAIPEHELQDMDLARATGIFNQISSQPERPRVKNILWRSIAAAAILFLALGAGIGFYAYQTKKVRTGNPESLNDIGPGKNTAILKLAGGGQIQLSETKTGLVIHAGKLAYNDGTALSAPGSRGAQELSIQTPAGGTYQVMLSDGTKVWLNSASSVSFPATFSGTGHNRTVKLSGEAYFEVKKDQHLPFIVQTKDQNVEVLGTHFNINSYPEEHRNTTTLLEGSVRISGKGIHEYLKPGEQSVLDTRTSQFRIQSANLKTAVAWKNGYFRFDAERIDEVMTKLSRWYNVEITYQGPISEEKFSANISRQINLKGVLKMLSYSGDVQFKIEGRRVIVMQ
ncbi:FecR family protein [Pedobacter caeni]|uniref:FecR family protein n=1 Tax=Pedobacter caeni TaxID=288992 RepID=A0A1M5L671_9SPHI|nr:FecR family protein [Pedobacter caeni]SHG60594.1 FecR family protein [Pedobacter caeni]